MKEHIKQIYSGKLTDRVIMANCPHCKSMMIPVEKKKFVFRCFECDVEWYIKLVL